MFHCCHHRRHGIRARRRRRRCRRSWWVFLCTLRVVVAVVVGQTTVLGETTKFRHDSRVTRYPHYYYTQQQQKTTERSGRSTSDGRWKKEESREPSHTAHTFTIQHAAKQPSAGEIDRRNGKTIIHEEGIRPPPAVAAPTLQQNVSHHVFEYIIVSPFIYPLSPWDHHHPTPQ